MHSRDASLGLYVSVPFCPTKCSYCNFASDVASAPARASYPDLLLRELELTLAGFDLAPGAAAADSVYWGGGTPTLLAPADFLRIARALQAAFPLSPDCEYTVEAAPGTLTPALLEAFAAAGVNRVSFGVQSFVDAEARAVGRRHDRATVLADLVRLRAAGISNLNLDLIAGLPHQTAASWIESLETALATGVPHVSVYLLEVDEDSRLGGELLRGGHRYHADQVPADEDIAGFYEVAAGRLAAGGLEQYEISNFARPGFASRHNERYWLRRPYLGLGLDAHSFLEGPPPMRFANADRLEDYAAALAEGRLPRAEPEWLSPAAALEETMFLGLRRNAGVSLPGLRARFGAAAEAWLAPRVDALVAAGLLDAGGAAVRLTARGRLLSNEVFAEFLDAPAAFAYPSEDSPCADVSAPRA